MFKKILLSFLMFLVVFQGTAAPILAQTEVHWYDQSITDWYSKVYDIKISPPQEIFGERYTAAQVQWVVYSLLVFVLNQLFKPEFTACVIGADTNTWHDILPGCIDEFITGQIERFGDYLSFLLNLAIGDSGTPNLALSPENPTALSLNQTVFQERPLSAISYIKDRSTRLTFVKEVHAQQQGFGFGALSALQTMWKASRDIAYSLLIFAAIILAFMVMLRTKISPQTVITAQSAIPKLIFAAILITFSYAIAGFMVDMVYVIIGIISSLFTPLFTGSAPTITSTIYTFLTSGPAQKGVFAMFMLYFWLIAIGFPVVFLLGVGIIFLAALPFGGPLVGVLFLIIFLVAVVIFVALQFFKVILMLGKALVGVYLLVITGPIYIMAGTVYQGLSFGSWLRSLASNLIVFPVTGVMFLLSYVFLGYGSLAGFTGHGAILTGINKAFETIFGGRLNAAIGTGWSPPLLTSGGTYGPALIYMLVSLALLSLTPKVADILKSFMSGRPFAYGAAIGEAWGTAGRFAESQYLGRMGVSSQEKIIAGGGNALDRIIAQLAERRGHIQTTRPSPQSTTVRRTGGII